MEHLSDVVTPVEAILRRCDSQHVMLHYTIPEYSNAEEFLAYLAKRIGKLKKGQLRYELISYWLTSIYSLHCTPNKSTSNMHLVVRYYNCWFQEVFLILLLQHVKFSMIGIRKLY